MVDGKKIIVVLIAVLVAVVGVGAAVFFLVSPGTTTPTPSETVTPPPARSIDLSVLQRSDYTQLDSALLQQGALPVQPPVGAGKANPFL